MKQVFQNRQGETRVEEVPEPLAGPGQLLVRTEYSLISSGTERASLKAAQRSLLEKVRQRPEQLRKVLGLVQQHGPAQAYQKVKSKLNELLPVGYSASGRVISVGERVSGFRVGDAVCCAGGGYANHAEVIAVPKNLCARVPGALSAERMEEVAFGAVGAIALQGVRRAEPGVGETVAVIGLGLVGLLTAQILKASGCRVLGIDPAEERARLAGELAAQTSVGEEAFVEAVSNVTHGAGADAVIITAGTESSGPINLAARICRDRGRVVVVGAVGMDLDREPFYLKELDVRLSRSYGPGRYDRDYEERGRNYPIGYVRWTEQRNLEAFLELVAEGKVQVKPLISERFPIESAREAYARLADEQARNIGIVLEYGESEKGGEEAIAVADAETAAPAGPEKDERVWLVRNPPAVPEGTVRVGLIGAGGFARQTLLPLLSDRADVVLRGVTSAGGVNARNAAEEYRAHYIASSPAAVLHDPEVDAVLIATRHDTHSELAIHALGQGKAVFVEKPLAINEQQLTQLRAAFPQAEECARLPHVFQVGFNRRFAPLVREMKALLTPDSPSCIQYQVRAGAIPPDHWVHDPEIGGGRIIGECCHFIDLMMFLCGSEPETVFAQALPDQGRYCQDNVSVQVGFANGSIGTLSYLAGSDDGAGKERIEVSAAGRTLILDDFRRLELSREGRVQTSGKTYPSPEKGHREELTAFFEAVKRHSASPIPFVEAALVTETTFRILESLQRGEPVRVRP